LQGRQRSAGNRGVVPTFDRQPHPQNVLQERWIVMKMMKSLVVVSSLALALCVALAPIAAQGVQKAAPGAAQGVQKAPAFQIQGVTDTAIHVINGNRDKNTKITARPNDVIQINWALKASPPTTSVSVGSSNPSVVLARAVRRLDNINGPSGAGGDIVVRFLARKKGTATVTFVIRRSNTDFSVVKSEVEVR
jgi:hypothetical protein